jgi:hypothetical protein
MDLSFLSIVYCQVKVSARGRSLLEKCRVSQCYRKASTMRTSWPQCGLSKRGETNVGRNSVCCVYSLEFEISVLWRHSFVTLDYYRRHTFVTLDYYKKDTFVTLDYYRGHNFVTLDYYRRHTFVTLDYYRRHTFVTLDYYKKHTFVTLDY